VTTDGAKLMRALELGWDMDGWLPDRNKDVVAWDLDSSMFSTLQRQWFIPKVLAGEATWKDYSMLCGDDVPFPASVALCRFLRPFVRQVAISARDACAADLTIDSVARHNIPLDDILLREEGDETPSGMLKVNGIRKLEAQGYKVRLMVEDWPDNAAVIRTHTDVPVLVLNPCYPGPAVGGFGV
jgi:hypothetical protein